MYQQRDKTDPTYQYCHSADTTKLLVQHSQVPPPCLNENGSLLLSAELTEPVIETEGHRQAVGSHESIGDR